MILKDNGRQCLDGYGRYIDEHVFYQGHFTEHKMHGQGKIELSDGTCIEG